MTTKDYIVIARALNDARAVEGADDATLRIAAELIASALKYQLGPQFDRLTFLQAAIHGR